MVTGQAATLLVRNTSPSTPWLESNIKRHVIFFSIDICVLTFGFFAVFGIDKDTLNSSFPVVFFQRVALYSAFMSMDVSDLFALKKKIYIYIYIYICSNTLSQF